ncbi:MAG: ABC transporter transmembrane domain-containing protein [Deferrisomatales bacterium]|nr:ABC transporter transmembrane domain-containing protein [Deferrisomatales bacterium]
MLSKESSLTILSRLGTYFVPYVGRIVLSILCMAVVGSTAGATAWLVKPVLDEIFIQHDVIKLQIMPFLILGLYAVKGAARYAQSFIMRWIGERVILQMREDVMANFQRRDVAFFDRHTTGPLMNLALGDVGQMYAAIPSLIQMLRSGFTVAGLLFVLFFRDWQLALLALVVFPLAAYPVRRIGILLRSYARRSQEESGALLGIIQEAFSGIEIVKTFRAEEREIGRFRASGERLFRIGMKRARLHEVTAPMMEFLGAVGAALIIWYGGNQVLTGTSTPGEFFSFLAALFMLYDPLKRSGNLINAVQTALASADRVFGMLDSPIGGSEVDGPRTLGGDVEEVRFDGVVFCYDETKGEVLKGIDLMSRQGQMVALVGLSGGGKSTILRLLPRFYDPQAGSISINGVDIREYTVASLRDAIALVTQDTFLFNDTVRANILVGRADADDAAVRAAAEAAHAREFIETLPDGYDTVVGERGDLLSGGQRQRIAIARAILKDAPILLLDEATSALDSASEKAVQAALDTLMKGRTSFVIAHRLATVRHADQIHVIQDGMVVESGTHDDLLARDGEYARFCALQFAGERVPEP